MDFATRLHDVLHAIRAETTHLDWTDRIQFIQQLVFMYHVIRASENLLRVAVEQSEKGTELHAYLVEHLEEERGHEAWLAKDLLTAGVDVTQTVCPVEARLMPPYYAIFHEHPRALLGYMAVLEFFPMSLDLVEELERMHGVDLLRTLKYHAVHDIDHGNDLQDILNKLKPEEQELVFNTAVQTARYHQCAVNRMR